MVKLQTVNNRKSGQAIFAVVSIVTILIFFVLFISYISSVVISPSELDLKLPSSNSDSIVTYTISLSIHKNGTFYIEDKEVDKEDLVHKLEQEIQKEEEPESVTIIIDAEKGTPITDVVRVMDVARILKVAAILSTKEE